MTAGCRIYITIKQGTKLLPKRQSSCCFTPRQKLEAGDRIVSERIRHFVEERDSYADKLFMTNNNTTSGDDQGNTAEGGT